MLKTLNTLSPLIIDEHRNMTLEEIAEAYRKDLNPSLLALAFHKTFKLIIDISKRYYGLSSEDIASFSLEKLDFALQTYKADESNFTTYFSKILMNKFREETEALNTHKRKAIFFSDSYEAIKEKGFDIPDYMPENEDLDYILKPYNLTERELAYCKLIIADYTNAEISMKLGVSVMTLSNIRKRLRKKLIPLTLEF